MRYIDVSVLGDLYGALRTGFHHNNAIKRELDVMCA